MPKPRRTRTRTLAVAVTVAALPATLAAGALASSQGDEVRPVRPLALQVGAPVAKQAAAQALQARAWRPPPVSEDRSRAIGKPYDGRLRNGLLLPAQGQDFLTFDSILERAPSREWRRHATGRLLRVVYGALRDYREANPDAPRVLVGDLSRPGGGWFGREYGGLGHASHQNGLDIDLYYPRRDGRQRKPARASQVDRRLAQELIDAFLARPEVRYAFVGLNVGLTGPRKRVQRIAHHDDHVHIRVYPAPK